MKGERMKLKTLILTGFIMSLTFCAYAQEEVTTDEWFQDFNTRRDAALEEYKSQGLSQDEIREKMASFRDEAQSYRETNGLEGSGNKNQNRAKDGSGDGKKNQIRLRDGSGSGNGAKDGSGNKKQYRYNKRSSFGIQTGSGNMRRSGSGGGRRGR